MEFGKKTIVDQKTVPYLMMKVCFELVYIFTFYVRLIKLFGVLLSLREVMSDWESRGRVSFGENALCHSHSLAHAILFVCLLSLSLITFLPYSFLSLSYPNFPVGLGERVRGESG